MNGAGLGTRFERCGSTHPLSAKSGLFLAASTPISVRRLSSQGRGAEDTEPNLPPVYPKHAGRALYSATRHGFTLL